MVNKAILVGRLGKEPEVRVTQSGKNSAKFTLATDTGWGQNKRTDWHNITCFDKQADFVKSYLHKGSLVYVEGTIRYSEYEKDGVKRYFTEIWANTIQSLSKGDNGAGGNFAQDQSYGGTQYGGGAARQDHAGYGSAPQASSMQADGFGDDGISNDDIPF